MAPVRRGKKVVVEVAEIDETPTTQSVPHVETDEVVEQTKSVAPTRRVATKEMTPEEMKAIEAFASFLNGADALTTQFVTQGMPIVFEAILKKGNKTTAPKMAAGLAEATQSYYATQTGGKKKSQPRRKTAQKVIQVQPEFARVLQNEDIQAIQMKNGKTIAEAIVSADEGDGIGLANNAFLSVFWGILAEYFQTEKKENGEPCYPKHPDTAKAGAHLTKPSKKLPKELSAFFKKVNKEWVMMTEAMTVVKNHVKTDVVMGHTDPETELSQEGTEEVIEE